PDQFRGGQWYRSFTTRLFGGHRLTAVSPTLPPPPWPVGPIRARSEANLRGIACRHALPCRDTWPHDQGRNCIPTSCPTLPLPAAHPQQLDSGSGNTGLPSSEDQKRMAEPVWGQGQAEVSTNWLTSPLDTKFSAKLR